MKLDLLQHSKMSVNALLPANEFAAGEPWAGSPPTRTQRFCCSVVRVGGLPAQGSPAANSFAGTFARGLIYHPPQLVPAAAWPNSLFVAGAISGACDWQTDFAQSLRDTDLTLLNPRRETYDSLDPNALREQIRWEHDGLRGASAISFWFPAGALCLISLYELGSWAHWRDENGQPKPLFVAAQPDYVRYQDVTIQLELERPDVQVVGDLDALHAQILNWQHAD